MALSPNLAVTDFTDLNRALEEFLQQLSSTASQEETKRQGAEAPGTAVETSSVGLPEGQGDCPLSSDDFVSLLDDLLEGWPGQQVAEDEAGSSGPFAPLEQGPSSVTTEMQTSEPLPARDAAAPAALPAPLPAAAEEVEGRSDAGGPANSKRRPWVRFSPYQRRALTARFKANRNVSADEVEALAAQLGLSASQVRNWFRNERKKYNKWFAHLLDAGPGADPKTLHALTQGMSSRTGAGSMAQRLLNN
uniref:Homeobox protein Dlx1a-like n=1 Tax=Phascolarctos cinereus TaxID=38626 RepID=A0A6P5JSY8_PHACI|nr:homeobox protein Dlx1a-like [Phascolarctos cinereus]